MNKLLKVVVLAVVVYLAWRHGLPWLKREMASTPSSSSSSAPQGSCTQSASAASEAWGRGLHQFVNPPYDVNAWTSFRQDVESKISNADSECNCSSESCSKVKSAMRDLRSLVADLDSSIRSGSAPPSDAAQRQEAVDRQIDEAVDLVRSGK